MQATIKKECAPVQVTLTLEPEDRAWGLLLTALIGGIDYTFIKNVLEVDDKTTSDIMKDACKLYDNLTEAYGLEILGPVHVDVKAFKQHV